MRGVSPVHQRSQRAAGDGTTRTIPARVAWSEGVWGRSGCRSQPEAPTRAHYPRVLRGLGSPPCPTAPPPRKLGGHPHCIARLGSHHRGEWTSRQRIDARVASRREWWPGSGSLGTESQCWPEVCGNAHGWQSRQSDLSMPERVPDLGAVERAHSSIKLCAASLFETCSTGVEVAQNPATKDEIRGRAKSMKRAASRVGPDR